MHPNFFFDKLFCRKFCPGGTHANTETFQIKKFFPPGKLAIKSLLLCDFRGGALLPIILRGPLAKGSDYTLHFITYILVRTAAAACPFT